MAEEVGLGERLRFANVGAGFFADGEMHDFNGIGDLLRFAPLSPLARLRLGWFVAQCQLRGSPRKLDRIPLETWLRRICGTEVVERIWKPLLASRFDGDASGLPATYLWARTRRMSGARESKGSGGEAMGHIVGGHQVLIDAIADRAEGLGVEILTDAPVSGLTTSPAGAVTGVELEGERRSFDLTIATLQPPALRFLLPDAHQRLLARLSAALARLRLPDPQGPALAAALLRRQHRRADADHQRGRDDAGDRHRQHRRQPPRLRAEVLRPGGARAERARRVDLYALQQFPRLPLARLQA